MSCNPPPITLPEDGLVVVGSSDDDLGVSDEPVLFRDAQITAAVKEARDTVLFRDATVDVTRRPVTCD